MSNIRLLLAEAGSGLDDIVKVTIYLIDPRYREPVYGVWGGGSRASTRSRPGSSSTPSPGPSGWWKSMPRP